MSEVLRLDAVPRAPCPASPTLEFSPVPRRLTLAWRDDLGPIWVPTPGGARTVVVEWPMVCGFVDVDALEASRLCVWEVSSAQLVELRRIHETWSLEKHDVQLVGHRIAPTTESLAAWVGFAWLRERARVVGEDELLAPG